MYVLLAYASGRSGLERSNCVDWGAPRVEMTTELFSWISRSLRDLQRTYTLMLLFVVVVVVVVLGMVVLLLAAERLAAAVVDEGIRWF